MFRRHDLDRDSLDFWRRQRRAAQRSRGRRSLPYGGSGNRATIALIGLLVLGLVLQYVVPLAAIAALPLGQVWLALYSTILPGSILGLVFVGLFVWMLGAQLEALDATWKYLALYFVSGTLGALAGFQFGAGLAGSLAAFGLAGGYAYVMWAHGWTDQAGVWRWVLGLLVLNALLSFLQPGWIAAMVTALVAGFGFAYLTRYGS